MRPGRPPREHPATRGAHPAAAAPARHSAPKGSADPVSPLLRSLCGAGWPAGRPGPGPPPQLPPRLLPLAVEPRRPPVTLSAPEPEPSRTRAAAAAAAAADARRSQASSQRAGRGVGGGGPEGRGRARGAHWDWRRRPDPQPRGVSVGSWECAGGARRASRRPPTLPPHLSRAPTSRTPPLAACGFLLLFVVWLGSFFEKGR